MSYTQNTVDVSPWYTSEEAAIYLKVFKKDGTPNVSYVYKQVCFGLLKAYKLGKFNRYRREDLDALILKGA
ncbi:MAG: helix-turn-helix domain-containing protein [Bacteroidetes bacterium]|nr:helix-turn-helix domain-containing protein [Bacteroidota bacterium]